MEQVKQINEMVVNKLDAQRQVIKKMLKLN